MVTGGEKYEDHEFDCCSKTAPEKEREVSDDNIGVVAAQRGRDCGESIAALKIAVVVVVVVFLVSTQNGQDGPFQEGPRV